MVYGIPNRYYFLKYIQMYRIKENKYYNNKLYWIAISFLIELFKYRINILCNINSILYVILLTNNILSYNKYII